MRTLSAIIVWIIKVELTGLPNPIALLGKKGGIERLTPELAGSLDRFITENVYPVKKSYFYQ